MNPPIEFKAGVDLLGRIDLIEFAVMATISGDPGSPLTASPASRRNMAVILTDVARTLDEMAAAIDPLAPGEPIPFMLPDSAEDTTSPTEPGA